MHPRTEYVLLMGMSAAIWINAFSPGQILTFRIGDRRLDLPVERYSQRRRKPEGPLWSD
jgi:hypothetical protein